jgi:formylglycine-generating enzyme required for sulfatase activity
MRRPAIAALLLLAALPAAALDDEVRAALDDGCARTAKKEASSPCAGVANLVMFMMAKIGTQIGDEGHKYCAEVCNKTRGEARGETRAETRSEPGAAQADVEAKSGLGFISIPAGTFQFQGERSLSVKAFQIGATAVTVDAYARCVKAGACTEPLPGNYQCNWKSVRTNHPINCVDWNQATAFCKWIGGRLPTDEEREYVASGGSENRTYPWGNDEPGERACWHGKGSKSTKGVGIAIFTCDVGTHTAGDSRWGVHDLAGNVWEWTSSDYNSKGKVARGGSWVDPHAQYLQARNRNWWETSAGINNVGFRCVR